jgi:hypothetical protein
VSGLKIAIEDDEASGISVQKGNRWVALKPDDQYQLVTSDYQAKVATGYREILAPLEYKLHHSSLKDLVRKELNSSGAAAVRDGRIYSKL